MVKKIFNYPILFLLSAVIWAYIFRGFLSGHWLLTGDAVPYFEHIKFFIDNVSRGVYPLWDPTRDGGVPNDFFLRRFGQFNPFFWAVLVFNKTGLSYIHAYLIFLAGYFWLGLLGFWAVLKKLFSDSALAFLGYALLLFSSFPAILFKSFLIFLFVPMIWLVYFVLGFSADKDKKHFWGMIFTLMIILNTYLPFYFLTILLCFSFTSLFIIPREMLSLGKSFRDFFLSHKLATGLSIVLVIMSVWPGWELYQELSRGDLVLPIRQSLSGDNALVVPEQSLAVGGWVWFNLAAMIFPNPATFQLGQFYLPLAGMLLIGLSFFTAINKLNLFLIINGILFYLLTLYDASPVYPFLYKYVFYFKYFRNFQFILWIVLFPMMIVWCVGQMQQVLVSRKLTIDKQKLLMVLWLMIVLQSFYTFSNLKNKAEAAQSKYPYRNAHPDYLDYHLSLYKKSVGTLSRSTPDHLVIADFSRRYPVAAYLTTKYSYELFNQFDPRVIDHYRSSKFRLFDDIKSVPDWEHKVKDISQSWLRNENAAFVSNPDPSLLARLKAVSESRLIEKFHDLEVLEYDLNNVRLKTHVNKNKFLVFNDHYERGWKAFIDSQEVPVYLSNIAFKGVFVPEGEHEILFQYRSSWAYGWNYFLHAVFIGVLAYVLIQFIPYEKEKETIIETSG